MLAVPVVSMEGTPLGTIEVDPAVLGGPLRLRLIKQAVVAYLDHQRQRSARTKSRSDVEGSTRKLYRQKGTGRARAGTVRTPVRRGGGRAFARRLPGSVKQISKKMRRAARNSAIAAQIRDNNVLVVEGLEMAEPRTKVLASMFSALGAKGGCVLALEKHNDVLYRSGRNIPGADIRVVDELNAYDVLRRPKLIFTRPAFERITPSAPGTE